MDKVLLGNPWSKKFILPDHRLALKQLAEERQKVKKASLDEQQIEEMEMTVAQSMEDGNTLLFEIYDEGYIRECVGSVHYIDHIRKEFRMKDENGGNHYIKFENIMNIKNI
ncbi:YolD-like family protein [Bacillus sonorensis]|uniref:YolD-like family protein n=1 Tax=Bacillus sonorensis TaxID=119858 RepID=UPI002DB58F80|nr:YolD-like family protein [Bacillus sonorensis]MEC0342012.1 YolD-like family protein [Bacillus sonorensis]MEC0457474.1 YolD-like family protein [Bacillus sonorensis]MEC0530731.1 YolD-like family protein [Bacillus sonorensis]